MSIESLEHMVRNRVRLFLRHTWLVAICGTLILLGAVWAAVYFATESNHMRIAAGPRDVRFVQALTDQIAKQHRDIQLQLVPTTSAKDSAEAMSKGQADLAILPSNLVDSLNWPVVAILRQNVMALIVPASAAIPAPAATAAKPAEKSAPSAKADKTAKSSKAAKGGKSAKNSKSAKGGKGTKSDNAKSDDSDDDSTASTDSSDGNQSDGDKLTKISQLSGKRVGIIAGNEASKGLLELLLSHYGVVLSTVTLSEIELNNVADAIKNNQVDVLFAAGPATGQAISSAVTAATVNGAAPNFIAIDQAEGIAKRNPAFDSVDIDAGTFGGNPPTPDDSLKSLSFPEYLVARKSFSDSAVATVAKALYTSRQSLAIALPGEVKIEAPSTDKDADAVLHPGALAYLSDTQQSFFDKYGDD
ncbi:MAG TPA: TAXI family TRAP transporter solute-binding subunit, partial [Xanthobacteraceae bacterium]